MICANFVPLIDTLPTKCAELEYAIQVAAEGVGPLLEE